MGIERRLADRGEKISFPSYQLPEEMNNNNKSTKSRRRQKKMTSVQTLFKTCKEVFASGGTGIIPPPRDIEKLRSILDRIRPEDVGLEPEMPYFQTSRARRRMPKITYLHIYECETFSMGIFCLPPSGVIPLHNHPGMTVFSKLLFGTMHIKSYDWVTDLPPHNPTSFKPNEIESSEVRLAKVKFDADFTAPCNTSILYPADGGNMHCFTAVTACAVLDVLGPPYSDPHGRPCTYYHNYPFSSFSVDGISIAADQEEKAFEWLQERDKPEGLQVVGTSYGGPQIVVEH